MKMRRFFPQLVVLLMGCVLLSGCNQHWQPHSRREVLAFIKAGFPREDITVVKKYTNSTSENGKQSPFRVWDC